MKWESKACIRLSRAKNKQPDHEEKTAMTVQQSFGSDSPP